MLSPSKDYQPVVKQQPDPATNVAKASYVWLINRDKDMVQHIRPINISVSQEIFIFR